jgi:hypothetical protein
MEQPELESAELERGFIWSKSDTFTTGYLALDCLLNPLFFMGLAAYLIFFFLRHSLVAGLARSI